jgi:magnesium chelatase family protein
MRRLSTILPAMPLAEALEPTRPCRAPHQTLADAGLIGGGQVPRPGEGLRARHGVRFLDA